MELFSIRKIRIICPRGCGPGPPAPAHGSTDFIKHRLLATGSTAQIKPNESVSRLLISAVHHRSDGWGGWLQPWAARHGRARRLTGVGVLSYGGRFLMRFAPMGSQWWGERGYANLNRRRAGTEPRNGEVAMVREAFGEASAPRTCAKASLSSLIGSRPTNCSERRRKTWIWWLPRVRRVLDLWHKICTICSAIYRSI
jgi:hypothetical protein